MQYKAELEARIKKELIGLQLISPLATVTVSETGSIVTIGDGEVRMVRRISDHGKRLLSKGEAWLVTGESLLEPEDKGV